MMTRRVMPLFSGAVEDVPNRSLEFTAANDESLQLSTANWGSYSKSKWAFSVWAQRKNDLGADALLSIGDALGATPAITIKFEFWRQISVLTYNATTDGELTTNAVFSPGNGYEAGNWYHIYVTFDTSLTAADRLQLIVDGTRVTSFATQTNPAGNIDTITGIVAIGRQTDGSSPADAYFYQPAFFSGTIPDVADLREGSGPADLRGMTGLWSLLHTTDASTLEDDEIISTNWTNNNTVVKNALVP